HATRPRLSERTPSLSDFITHLSSAEALLDVPDEPETDPLDALPGTLLAGRFRLRRRLGSGSTAVGLLVADESQKNAPERVLKVAINDDAARRLEQEAAVLAKITKIGRPRPVQLLEGPTGVGGRRTTVVEPAGAAPRADDRSCCTRHATRPSPTSSAIASVSPWPSCNVSVLTCSRHSPNSTPPVTTTATSNPRTSECGRTAPTAAITSCSSTSPRRGSRRPRSNRARPPTSTRSWVRRAGVIMIPPPNATPPPSSCTRWPRVRPPCTGNRGSIRARSTTT